MGPEAEEAIGLLSQFGERDNFRAYALDAVSYYRRVLNSNKAPNLVEKAIENYIYSSLNEPYIPVLVSCRLEPTPFDEIEVRLEIGIGAEPTRRVYYVFSGKEIHAASYPGVVYNP